MTLRQRVIPSLSLALLETTFLSPTNYSLCRFRLHCGNLTTFGHFLALGLFHPHSWLVYTTYTIS